MIFQRIFITFNNKSEMETIPLVSDGKKRQQQSLLPPKGRGRLFFHLFPEPVLAVDEPGNDVGYHIVAGCIDHGGRGIHQIA